MAQDKRIPELPQTAPGTPLGNLVAAAYNTQTGQTEGAPAELLGQGYSNAVRGSVKIVLYYSSTYYGVPASASTLDRLTQASLAMGTTATVLNPAQNPTQAAAQPGQYVLVPAQASEAGAIQVYADADPATTALVYAKWVPQAQQQIDGLPYFDENTVKYPAGSTVKYLAGTVRAFEATQQLLAASYPSNKIPAPTTTDGAALWNEIFVNGGTAFVYIAKNQYGLHPEFKAQAALNAYLLGNQPATGTPPTAPFVSFNTATRILTATHALGDAEIEYSTGGYYSPYQAIQVDNKEHKGGSWLFRTRAIPGRPASSDTPNPYIAPVITQQPGQPAPTITGFTPGSGAAGTSVTLTGTGFISGATAVKFGSLAAASVTFLSATQLEVVAPTNVTTAKISATTAGGTATSTNDFTVATTTPTNPAGQNTAFTYTLPLSLS